MKLNSSIFKSLIPIVGFFILASIYFGPLYSGKILVQSDNVQLTGVNKEIFDYREKGDPIYWNTKEFSGRPVLGTSNYNPFGYANRLLFNGEGLPKPVMMLFMLFVGMFILFRVFKVSVWLAGLGAMAYAFASFNVISIEVGHDNKVMAMAFMAPVLGGVILAYRGDLLKGALLTVIAAGFQLFYGHIQITYYLLLMVLGYVIIVLIDTIKNNTWSQFVKASLVLAGATIIAAGCNFTKLYSTLEYADYSNRGGSELSQGEGSQVSQTGLDKEYALSWSSGKMETFTLIFPYFHGGASSEKLDSDSRTAIALNQNGVPQQSAQGFLQNVPLYWGDQPFTGGPIYFGAIICFLFILSFFVLDGPIRWWGLALAALSILLSMGKNLEWFTDIFFYYFPLYNKFRSVTMILAIAQLVMPLLGIMALDKIIAENGDKRVEKTVLQVGGAIIALGLFFVFFKNSFFDFAGQNDQAYNLPEWLLNAIQADRKDLFNWSIYRAIIFILVLIAGIWSIYRNWFKSGVVIGILAVVILIDLWSVDKRYVSSDDFATKKRVSEQQFAPTAADKQILKDESYFRVLNLTAQNPFSDGLTSYHHHSILGYNAIKMQRYQELIDRYIRNVDKTVLNMLNTKYIIGKGQNGPMAQMNAEACGNAWLVKNLQIVNNADEEIDGIADLEPKEAALIDKQFLNITTGQSYSGDGSIALKNYHPEEMTYSFNATQPQFAVFSEIYYRPGWNAYLDGNKVDYARVDYVLRGMELPAGQHEIVFKYEPVSLRVGKYVILGCSLILLALIVYAGFISYKSKSI